MPFTYKRHMQKSTLLFLSLFEKLGTYALDSSHVKFHRDFKALTLRKDDAKSLSLHYGWWIQGFPKFLHLSPPDFRMKTVEAESFSSWTTRFYVPVTGQQSGDSGGTQLFIRQALSLSTRVACEVLDLFSISVTSNVKASFLHLPVPIEVSRNFS